MISPLDHPISLTFFENYAADKKREEVYSLRSLRGRVLSITKSRKADLPWLKAARFGDLKTNKNSLRHDSNVIAITGIEADYDGERVTIDEAVEKLTQAGVAALVYASPSHTEDTPRWRVVCPTSEELPPERRAQLIGRLNGLFGGILAGESWTLSQSYYYGSVNRNPSHRAELVEGDYIDRLDDLDQIWIGKPATGAAPRVNGHAPMSGPVDRDALLADIMSGASYHTSMVRLAGKLARSSMPYLEARQQLQDAMLAVPEADRDRRWQERWDDLDRTLEDIYGKEARRRDSEPPRHEPEPPPKQDDAGYWTSLERHLLDGPPEAPPPPDEETPSTEPLGGIIDPRLWTAPAPLRQWLVPGWIPIGEVTGLYGDGGHGKSLILQQLMTSVALNLPWLGMDVSGGRAFGLMCEDSEPELHRRQDAINAGYGVANQHLENLRLTSRVGADNLLMTFDDRNRGSPTELFAEVVKYLADFRPKLVVLDTLADIFGGDEVRRTQARIFIQGIGGNIARTFTCAVVIAAHPSLSGIASGKGTAGNTAWNNSLRSRLYLTKPEGDDKPNDRILERMKANYAGLGDKLTIQWRDGCFVPIDGQKSSDGDLLTWAQIGQIFREIDRAAKADEGWSNSPQTRKDGRYFPMWAEIHLGLSSKRVAKSLNEWITSGFLGFAEDTRVKKKWLIVRRFLQPEVGGNSERWGDE